MKIIEKKHVIDEPTVTHTYPLTHIQHHYLFGGEYADPQTVSVNQILLTLPEKVIPEFIWQAWREVVHRHELLRACVKKKSRDELELFIADQFTLTTQLEDWTDYPTEQQQQALQQYLRADLQKGFELTQALLQRFCLIKLAEKNWRLVWSSHAILVGGNAIPLVLREFITIYDALVNKQAWSLATPARYARHIEQLRQMDNSGDNGDAQAYWRKLLLGFKEPTELQLPRARNSATEKTQQHILFQIPLALIARLRRFAEENAITLNALMQGAFGILLARYTDTSDVVFGSLRAFPSEDVKNMAGLFINTLPVRAHYDPEFTVAHYLKLLREQHIKLREFIHTPLHDIRDWSDVPNDRALFNYAIDFRPQSFDAQLRGSVRQWGERCCNTDIFTNYLLFLQIHGEGSRFDARLYYASNVMDDFFASAFVQHYLNLLEGIIIQPQQLVKDLSMLSFAEEQQILREWNNTERPYPRDQSLSALFSQQVKKNPQQIAVIAEDQQITYAELDRDSTRLAAAICQKFPGSTGKPDLVIALCLESGIPAIRAMLAILKIGAAFAPIDPHYPAERIQYILEDTHCNIIITNREIIENQPVLADYLQQLIILDEVNLTACLHDHACGLDHHVRPENLACVIYTSGSTGKPKGVMVEQRNIVRLVKNTNYVTITEQDRVAQAANLAFDATSFEVWGALLNGATIVCVSRDTLLDIAAFEKCLIEKNITVLWLTVALFNQFAVQKPEIFRQLRYLLTGGDALNPQTIYHVLHCEKGRPQFIVNGYGPTENATFSTTHCIEKVALDDVSIPIGKPITNSTVLVLDRLQRLMPCGVPGELYVGGDGVARGYLNNPELTAEKFVTNPFAEIGGFKQLQQQRLYRTGDLVRFLPDGTLDFLGRRDRQIKIRGFRVEIGEIETILQTHSLVKQAAVMCREDVPGEKYLAAYLVAATDQAIPSGILREYLQNLLPYYMIPATFTVLGMLPITANGKVDHRALPQPDQDAQTTKLGYVAPRSHNETLLATIFAEVLQLPRAGVYDNFFESGGHSLRAMQILARIRKTFNVQLALADIFEHPTVVGLIQLLEQHDTDPELAAGKLPRLLTASRQQPAELSAAQQRLWFLDQLEKGNSFYSEPFHYELLGEFNIAAFTAALNRIIARHESLRTNFILRDSQPRQIIREYNTVQPEFIDFSQEKSPAAVVGDYVQKSIAEPFNLEKQSLIRCHILKLADNHYHLLLNLHHIIFDGWSFDILMRELNAFYRSAIEKASADLPELYYQYIDYTSWEKLPAQQTIIEKHLIYWQNNLKNAPQCLELPTDLPRPAQQTFVGALYEFAIPDQLAQPVIALAKHNNTTLYNVLLTTYFILLYRYTRQIDLLVGTVVANRDLPEWENIVGFFVNTLVLRAVVDPQEDFITLLHQVQRTTLNAFAHQSLPFDKLIEVLQPARSLVRNPLIQVIFALENVAATALDFPAVSCKKLPNRQLINKFDVIFTVKEDHGKLSGMIEYSADLFQPETIKRWAVDYLHLLQQISTAATTEIAQLSVVTVDGNLELIGYDQKQIQGQDFRLIQQAKIIAAAKQFVAPHTVLEKQLAEIWSEVLRVKKISSADNFFELGGHSLLVAQVVGRLQERYALRIPIKKIFEYPTIVGIAEYIEKTDLSSADFALPELQPQQSNQAPLSFAQRQLWFMDQLNPDSAFYNIPYAWRLRGDVDSDLLQQSFVALALRQPALRTVFTVRDQNVTQTILNHAHFDFVMVDLSARPQELSDLLQQAVHQAFSLQQGPLLRVTLFKLADQEYRLLCVMHHIISDGWSMKIFQQELAAFYTALKNKQVVDLPPLLVHYTDYACWQQKLISSAAYAKQMEYWTKQLANCPAQLELPLDYPRPLMPRYRGANFHFTFSHATTENLRQIAQQAGITLYMLLLSIFDILLYRYTGTTDICVGTPVAGRHIGKIENVLGYFVNVLVMRSQLAPLQSFTEFLHQNKQIIIEGFAQQDVPFEKLVEALHPERNLQLNPFFQVMFVLQEQTLDIFQMAAIECVATPLQLAAAKFDLTLSLSESASGLTGYFEYNTDLFAAASIERMAQHYQIVVAAAIADPVCPIGYLPLLSISEQENFLQHWQGVPQRFPTNTHLIAMFEQQVMKTPDAIALEFNDQHLTYCELNARANNIGRLLQECATTPNSCIAVCLDRSLDMIIAVLGILKSGSAYVPLDPAYPDGRIREIVEDCRATLLITQSEFRDRLQKLTADTLQLMDVANFSHNGSEKSEKNVLSAITPQSLAYVIYTSGSTGKPKGVLLEHGTVLNTIFAQIELFDMDHHSRVLQFSSLSFDAAVSEIFTALLSGACLVLTPRLAIMPGENLRHTLIDKRITVATIPPVALAVTAGNDLPLLRTVITAGDVCSTQIVMQWAAGRKFINAYGPTEASICATAGVVNVNDENPSIGKPIANVQCYVFDRYRQMVPVGVVGELYIGGAGVAHGYLRRDDLTTEKFITHAFSAEKNVRLYRSGDLVKWLPNGSLEFVGRIDNQVKLRGYRIELSEISNQLENHPAIRQAVALVKNPQDNPQLLAFIVPHAQTKITANELAIYLKEQLPSYMLPAGYVFLEKMPVTQNGKIDNRALLQSAAIEYSQRDYVAPHTATEKTLCVLWSQILKVAQVGVTDNFFDLGGSSLLATQLTLQIKEIFNRALPLMVFFQQPTIGGLAQFIDNRGIDPLLEMQNSEQQQAIEDSCLPLEIKMCEKNSEHYFAPRAILLTGASGFLGVQLLHDLLLQTEATVYCLVRAENLAAARKKLQQNLRQYKLPSLAFSKRIVVIPGDLEQAQFGLEENEYQKLAGLVDVIYHNAAFVHSTLPYKKLRAANVLGTLEIIRFATTAQNKAVHYVSTLSAAVARDDQGNFAESVAPEIPDGLMGAYPLSKWVSERLLQQLGERGLPFTIHRCGSISGHSVSGVANTNDSVTYLIKGCLQLGFAPDWTWPLTIAPVDFISQALVQLSLTPAAQRRVFHLQNFQALAWRKFILLLRSLDYSIQLCAVNQWQELLMTKVDKENALYPQLPMYLGEHLANMEQQPSVNTAQTQSLLDQIGVVCPPITQQLLRGYFNYFQEIGFMPGPHPYPIPL